MSSKENVIEVEGLVEESLPNATFRVILDGGQVIFCHLSGKMRVNFIKILPGDRVLIEMSVYDLSKGRIIRRLPINKNVPEPVVEEPVVAKPIETIDESVKDNEEVK